MTVVYALAVAAYVGCGLYMMLSRHIVRLVLGLALLTNGAILLIFVAGRLDSTTPAVIEAGTTTLAADAANALPQALVLTAIVIGFAVTAFATALIVMAYRRFGTLDLRSITAAESMGVPRLETSAPPATEGRHNG
jgi:multicomponent Na+:H+ antiporter subunit C